MPFSRALHLHLHRHPLVWSASRVPAFPKQDNKPAA
jgi:GH35 family endo-1,4-beta-xylanase